MTGISENLSGIFKEDQHHYFVRIYYEDTDFSGIVYHANYLRYMERARSDFLTLAGIDQKKSFTQGDGYYAVSEINIRYLSPAYFGDDLRIITSVDEIRAASVIMNQHIDRDGTAIAAARIIAAFLSPEGRPKRQTAQWREIYKKYTTY